MNQSNLHSHWSSLFLRAFVTSGVTHMVISPGSRSTPLALAAATEQGLTCHTMIDERVAAFFALGQARITKKPTLLLCTSGTAAAHYLPAIIEASLAKIPLIAITADRPWEAYENASSQTIDQVKLFGAHVRFYAELGAPDPSVDSLRAVPRLAAQAVSSALGQHPGPVHINARFRKPLEPIDAGLELWQPEWERLFAAGAPQVYHSQQEPSHQAIAAISAALARSKRTLLVCGPLLDSDEQATTRDAIIGLAQKLGAPVFAETSSGSRLGSPRGAVYGAFDAFLREPQLRKQIAPELILSFGMPPVSSSYNTWLTENPQIEHVIIAPSGWNDPTQTASILVFASPEKVASQLIARIQEVSVDVVWRETIQRVEAISWVCVERALAQEPMSEGGIARCLLRSLPEESVLLIGNSNPIRDLDTYGAPSEKAITVLHQRGASGIDGLLSGAAGAKSVTTAPVTLFLGDISFLHDLSGLNAVRAVGGPLVIVVVQNNGGRIFGQLPLGKRPELAPLIESYFATPQNVSLSQLTEGFGLIYERAEDLDALSLLLRRAFHEKQKVVIEAVVPSLDGLRQRSLLWREICAAVSALP
jgi:2-succinyl-5-enolpyruvyl-6-hydroxy-3-cyclohexene-1-carboxylate synthase